MISDVISDWFSAVIGKPALNSTSVLRPGISPSVFARLRSASTPVRMPNCPAVLSRGPPTCRWSTTTENLGAADHLLQRSISSVKFCAICSAPPKFATAIRRFGPALASMNFAAAWRAWIWSRHVHRRQIEEQHQVLLLLRQRRVRIRLEREVLDLLFFVVFPDLEVLLLEVVDVVALLVLHHHVHRHQPRLRPEDRARRAGRRRIRRLLRRRAAPPAETMYKSRFEVPSCVSC